MDKDIVKETYEKRAQSLIEHGYRTEWWYIANKALADWALLGHIDLRGKRVLNIGCSEPIDEMFYARLVKEWVAIDYSPKSIEIAQVIINKELAPDLAKKIILKVADARDLPFEDEEFDIVVAFSTIEHIQKERDRVKAFCEMVRVLKREGYLAVTVPNKWCLPYARWSIKAQKRGQTDFGFEHLFSPLELRRLFVDNGLEIIAFTSNYNWTSNVRYWPFTYVKLLSRYFGDRIGYLGKKI